MRSLPDLNRLRTFLTVGETLNFRHAAEKLGIAQPAVSKSVKALEDELGFKLLSRTTRHVSLTPAGESLWRNARKGFTQIDYGVRAAQQTAAGNAGTLIIGYSSLATHGPMAELIVQYKEQRPDVHTELFLQSSREQMDGLKEGSIDLGFLLTVACPDPATHLVLFKERLEVLVSRVDPLAERSEINLRELAQRPFVLGRQTRWSTFQSIVDSVCVQAGFLPNVVDEADGVPVLLRQISLRRGVSLFGSSIRENLPPDIVSIPITDKHAEFEISVAWLRDDPEALQKDFVQFAKEFCKDNQARLHQR